MAKGQRPYHAKKSRPNRVMAAIARFRIAAVVVVAERGSTHKILCFMVHKQSKGGNVRRGLSA